MISVNTNSTGSSWNGIIVDGTGIGAEAAFAAVVCDGLTIRFGVRVTVRLNFDDKHIIFFVKNVLRSIRKMTVLARKGIGSAFIFVLAE